TVCLQKSEEAVGGSPGTGVTDSCELLYGCWELNPGPLQEQDISSHPSLHSPSTLEEPEATPITSAAFMANDLYSNNCGPLSVESSRKLLEPRCYTEGLPSPGPLSLDICLTQNLISTRVLSESSLPTQGGKLVCSHP
ncbi:hypothetical protein STEG23_006982, partial [Scotinomys teguina]